MMFTIRMMQMACSLMSCLNFLKRVSRFWSVLHWGASKEFLTLGSMLLQCRAPRTPVSTSTT